MSDAAPREPVTLDPRLIAWMAREVVRDSRARLVDAGAAIEKQIPLATVFIDLPASDWEPEPRPALRTLCAEARKGTCVEAPEQGDSRRFDTLRRLIVGGPGSGKSTLSVMVAQALRLTWLRRQAGDIPEATALALGPHIDLLDARFSELDVECPVGHLPLRINLPRFAEWLSVSPRGSDAIWAWLAQVISCDDSAMEAAAVRAASIAAGSVVWIFDGLDEVPASAGRATMVAAVRDALAVPDIRHAVLVTTRPQGYEGEFDDLAALSLRELPANDASQYGHRLLRAWLGEGDELDDRTALMASEFERPEVAAMVVTPLHTTLAAVLIAERGRLPASRAKLFREYFDTSFRRELAKPGNREVREEDRDTLWRLHARVGLYLQALGERAGGTASRMSRRVLRETLREVLAERGIRGGERDRDAERLLRFTGERLVLIIEESARAYCFSVRSVQEFFAAEAIADGEPDEVKARVRSIALSPYWRNVVTVHGLRGAPVLDR